MLVALLLRSKVAMNTAFSAINKLNKCGRFFFATAAYFNDNR